MSRGLLPCFYCGEVLANRLQRSNHKCGDQIDNRIKISTSKKITSKKNIRILLKNGRLQLKDTCRCESCRCKFSNRLELQKHIEGKCGQKINLEKKSIDSMASRIIEEKIVDDSANMDEYRCYQCDILFYDSSQYRQHIIDNHLEPSEHSNRSIGSHLLKALKAGKETELRNGDNNKPVQDYPCNICDVIFLEKEALFEHTVKVHKKRLLYECSECGKMYAQRLALDRHYQGHATVDSNFLSSSNYECQFCGKQFQFESYLKRHVATHTSEAYYRCDICGDQFRSQGNLVVHKAEHTGSELFSCSKCGKIFPYKSSLERHYQTHISTPSPCPQCEKIFTIPAQLQKHLVIHHSTDETTLSCPQCDRKFLYPSYLERHMAMHIQNKEHQCPICQRQFAVRCALLTHLQRHLPESSSSRQNSNRCRFCTNSYRHESTLERHMEQVHGDQLGFMRKSKIKQPKNFKPISSRTVQIVNSISL